MSTSRNTNRQANTQPAYDFLAGGGSSPQKPRTAIRRNSSAVRPDIGNEDFRAQVKTLKYEVDALKQEREVTKLQHDKEVRDAQTRAEADFKRAQVGSRQLRKSGLLILAQTSESNKNVASHKFEALAQELKDLQDSSTNKEHDLEKKLRIAQEKARTLQDEVEEAQSELSSLDRQHSHRFKEIESKHDALQSTMRDLRAELEGKSSMLETTQQKLDQREKDIGVLENDILALKASSGDVEELATVKRELNDQVEHIRRLEKTNREQTTELRNLRQTHKATGIVEEEKRVLEMKVHRMDDLERELGEAKFQRQMLQDGKDAWASYLQSTPGYDGREYDSPEAIARALAEERLEKASLVERLGAIQPEVTEKEELIRNLEAERNRIRSEMEKLKTGGATSSSDAKAKVRIERQKNLAVKEVEYLREQLKTFESEDATGEIGPTLDEQTRKRISDLEDLVGQYRSELQQTSSLLSSVNSQSAATESLKRSHPDDSENSEQVGQLSRKNRKLQSDFQALHQQHKLLTTELSSTKSQLSSLKESSKTRVLSLRANPTDDFQNLKLSMITTLREENAALHSQLARSPDAGRLVPVSSLDSIRHELEGSRRETASREKTISRLKQVWSAKSLELREAIASILGWQVEIQANGKFRLTSIFNPGADPDNGECNYLTFDGEKGTVQVSGGPNGAFAKELKSLMRFWVQDRKEIPAFMAATTLEFYEQTTRAQRV